MLSFPMKEGSPVRAFFSLKRATLIVATLHVPRNDGGSKPDMGKMKSKKSQAKRKKTFLIAPI